MITDCYPLYYPFQPALAVFRPPVKANLTELERACRDRRTGSADFHHQLTTGNAGQRLRSPCAEATHTTTAQPD